MCRKNSRERILVSGIKSDDAGMLQDSLADLAEVAFCSSGSQGLLQAQARALQSADLALSGTHGLHESLDDLIVTAHTAWQDAQAGRQVEDHCARLLAAAQRLKRIFEAAGVAPDGAAVGHADADGPPAHPQDRKPG